MPPLAAPNVTRYPPVRRPFAVWTVIRRLQLDCSKDAACIRPSWTRRNVTRRALRVTRSTTAGISRSCDGTHHPAVSITRRQDLCLRESTPEPPVIIAITLKKLLPASARQSNSRTSAGHFWDCRELVRPVTRINIRANSVPTVFNATTVPIGKAPVASITLRRNSYLPAHIPEPGVRNVTRLAPGERRSLSAYNSANALPVTPTYTAASLNRVVTPATTR